MNDLPREPEYRDDDKRLDALIDSAIETQLVQPPLHPDTPPYDPASADAVLHRGAIPESRRPSWPDRRQPRRARRPIALVAGLAMVGAGLLLSRFLFSQGPDVPPPAWRGGADDSRILDATPDSTAVRMAAELRTVGAQVAIRPFDSGWQLQLDASMLDAAGRDAVTRALATRELSLPADGRMQVLITAAPQ